MSIKELILIKEFSKLFEGWINFLERPNFIEDGFIPIYWHFDKEEHTSFSLCSCLVKGETLMPSNEGESNFGDTWSSALSAGIDWGTGGMPLPEKCPMPFLRHRREAPAPPLGQKYEVMEEFRLLYNLFEDEHKCRLFYIDEESGEKEVISKYIDDEYGERVLVKASKLKEFIFLKDYLLKIQIMNRNFFKFSLDELKLKERVCNKKKTGADKLSYYQTSISKYDCGFEDLRTMFEFKSSKLVKGKKKTEEAKKYEEFIIGFDEDGEKIYSTCEAGKLNNSFGKNPDAPEFLEPVFFKKSVLDKYYGQSENFSVKDGMLKRDGCWQLQIDNNTNEDYISVCLGDLGERLPHTEQLHFKANNIYDPEYRMSFVNFQRSVMGSSENPSSPDLFFRSLYAEFNRDWEERFGWNFFKPLVGEDESLIKGIKIPGDNNSAEFGDQVLKLAKLMIDSLNEKKLSEGMQVPRDVKGIRKLELFLASKSLRCPELIDFFKNLQSLRSSGAAHLKGGNYGKAKEKLKLDGSHSENFKKILIECNEALVFFKKYLLRNS